MSQHDSDYEHARSSPVLSSQSARHMDTTDSSRNALHAPARSNPIAIRRNPSNCAVDTSDDGDDDDDGEIDGLSVRLRPSIGTNVLDSGATSTSLPSRLLRAPLLGSVPSTQYFILSQGMLPPAAAQLAGGAESVESSSISRGAGAVAYGSLRESNMKGRFLDGPSSYRDRRTGSIRPLQHRVRFHEPSIEEATHRDPQPLSIGERLMQGRKRQDESQSSKDEHPPLSSLATMLEAATIEHVSLGDEHETARETQPPHDLDACEALYDDAYKEIERSALSTSLTGLELLQSLRKDNAALSQRSTMEACSRARNLEALRRDSLGHNALLSRSFSDPAPNLKRAMQRNSIICSERNDAKLVKKGSAIGLTSAGVVVNLEGRNAMATPLSGDRSLLNESVESSTEALFAEGSVPLATAAAAYFQIYDEPIATTRDPSTEEPNPDIEGAFVMDLE